MSSKFGLLSSSSFFLYFFVTRQPQKPAWLSAPWASLTGAVVQQTGDVFEVYVSDRRETLGDVIANHRHLSHFSLHRCSHPRCFLSCFVQSPGSRRLERQRTERELANWRGGAYGSFYSRRAQHQQWQKLILKSGLKDWDGGFKN